MNYNPPTSPVYLKACGITTSLGLTVEQTAAAVRAEISAYAESTVYNRHFAPMIMSLVPEDLFPPLDDKITEILPNLTSKQARIILLAKLALDDLSNKHEILAGIPLLLACSESIPNLTETCHPQLIEIINQQSGISFNNQNNMLIAEGRAGGVKALYNAMAYLQEDNNDYAIVGGIDSYMDLQLLCTLDTENRILAEGVMDAFTPGEGAGFLLLSSKPVTFQDSDKQILIYPPGLSTEPGHRYSNETYKGEGLSQAFKQALSNFDSSPVRTLYSSLNGENFAAKEFGVATTRSNKEIDSDYSILHPADCFGDTGAAYFPVSVGLIAMGLINNYISGPVLDYASSETEFRGATCISMR